MASEHEEYIKSRLPYGKGFCFVDSIHEVSENHIVGSYFFSENLSFYRDHFASQPVTPGVILIECMAQIGLVSLGIYLIKESKTEQEMVFFSESNVQFINVVPPNSTVLVESKLVYYRFGKLKCTVTMRFISGEKIATGTLAGMVKSRIIK